MKETKLNRESIRINLILEGFDISKNITWNNFIEKTQQLIRWKIKVRNFLGGYE